MGLDRTNSKAGAPESARHAQHIATWSKASFVGPRSTSATHPSHTASAVSPSEEILAHQGRRWTAQAHHRRSSPPSGRWRKHHWLVGGYHRRADTIALPTGGCHPLPVRPLVPLPQISNSSDWHRQLSLATCRPPPLPGVRSRLERPLECHGIFVEDETFTIVVDVSLVAV